MGTNSYLASSFPPNVLPLIGRHLDFGVVGYQWINVVLCCRKEVLGNWSYRHLGYYKRRGSEESLYLYHAGEQDHGRAKERGYHQYFFLWGPQVSLQLCLWHWKGNNQTMLWLMDKQTISGYCDRGIFDVSIVCYYSLFSWWSIRFFMVRGWNGVQ